MEDGCSFPDDAPTERVQRIEGRNADLNTWMGSFGGVRQIAASDRIVSCWGGGSVALGHPVEYINLDGTTSEDPAVCKYCGLRYHLDHHH